MERTENGEQDNGRIPRMFDAYIKIVFRYRVLNALKCYARQRQMEIIWPYEAFEELCDDQEVPDFEKIEVNLDVVIIHVENKKLAEALKTLNVKQKTVIGYSFVLKLSAEEIAEILGIEIHGVYEHKCKAIKALRGKMRKVKIDDSG